MSEARPARRCVASGPEVAGAWGAPVLGAALRGAQCPLASPLVILLFSFALRDFRSAVSHRLYSGCSGLSDTGIIRPGTRTSASHSNEVASVLKERSGLYPTRRGLGDPRSSFTLTACSRDVRASWGVRRPASWPALASYMRRCGFVRLRWARPLVAASAKGEGWCKMWDR